MRSPSPKPIVPTTAVLLATLLTSACGGDVASEAPPPAEAAAADTAMPTTAGGSDQPARQAASGAEPSARIEDFPDACALLSSEEVAGILGVEAAAIRQRSLHNPNAWRSQCDWRVGSDLKLERWVTLDLFAGHIREEYESGFAALPYWSGGGDFTTGEYIQRVVAEPEGPIDHDPDLEAGAYRLAFSSAHILRVETRMEIASVPPPSPPEPPLPDKMILQVRADGADEWKAGSARDAASELAEAALEALEALAG